MALKLDLESEIAHIFKTNWRKREGNVVPDDESISLDNEAIELQATVLYADLADSTKLVDGNAPFFAAEIYGKLLALLCENYSRRGRGYYGVRWRSDHNVSWSFTSTSAVRAALKIRTGGSLHSRSSK